MRHILVAEDDPIILQLITQALQQRGHAVHFAYDVMQAVMTVSRARLDLVIVDMAMPGGTGFDVIQRMKRSNRTGPIPIVAISGAMDRDMARKARHAGADAAFRKPLDLTRFLEACDRLLAGHQAQDDYAHHSHPSAAPQGGPPAHAETCYHGA